jgi:hypothetical protein
MKTRKGEGIMTKIAARILGMSFGGTIGGLVIAFGVDYDIGMNIFVGFLGLAGATLIIDGIYGLISHKG